MRIAKPPRWQAALVCVLVLVVAAVLAVVLVRHGSDASEEGVPLVARQLYPAGTPGEHILEGQRRPMYSTNLSRPERMREGVIYDLEDLRGKAAIVDILPGSQLTTASFRPTRASP